MAAADACFELLDTLGGTFSLSRASATLDGSIPLRAAQACSPLLEGNRAGFQVVLGQRLTVARSLGRVSLVDPPERLVRALRGALPRYTAEGLLPHDSRWLPKLARGPVWREPSGLALFTGLFLRPKPETALFVSHAGNRKNVLFDVEERWLMDDACFTPLVLSLSLPRETRLPLSLHGELATLLPLAARVRLERRELAEAPELGRAHLAFYDQKYFEQKKAGATKKYKRMIARGLSHEASTEGHLLAVRAGPEALDVAPAAPALAPEGLVRRASGPPEHFRLGSSLGFAARFDGHDTVVEPDVRALERFAQATRAEWAKSFDARSLEEHRGAVWYFTKWITPHQPGEPLFFVKPPALFATPPGWSTLVEGLPGRGYEVLRGVIATDRFHALPAVIRLLSPGRRVLVKAGAPLARLLAVPRRLLEAGYDVVTWRAA